jgi:hypothetical protein
MPDCPCPSSLLPAIIVPHSLGQAADCRGHAGTCSFAGFRPRHHTLVVARVSVWSSGRQHMQNEKSRNKNVHRAVCLNCCFSFANWLQLRCYIACCTLCWGGPCPPPSSATAAPPARPWIRRLQLWSPVSLSWSTSTSPKACPSPRWYCHRLHRWLSDLLPVHAPEEEEAIR